MRTRLAAVSVDLDEIPCYAAIHGIQPADPSALHAIYDRALPRLRDFFAQEQVPATFFVIGRDLEREENGACIRELAAAGHEIANHSFSHWYDLTQRPRAAIRGDIKAASDAIAAVCGAPPRGFRAPGYTITDDVIDILQELGFDWDSSVFASAPYYLAKLAALGWMQGRGRQSRSIVGSPGVLRAPPEPYRVGRPYWKRGSRLVELPIAVTPGLRLPFIGTSVALAGARGARLLAQWMGLRSFVNLELHGIDLADRDEDGLAWLAPHQPDLRRSHSSKARALQATIRTLRERGYRFVTLSEAATQTVANA